MLKRISISHYKSIEQIHLNFGRSNVIVGPNGAGKSNLIDCLNFVRDAALQDLDSAATKRHGAESVRQWSKYRPFDVTIDMSFESGAGSGSYKVILSSSGGIFRVKEESGNWFGSRTISGGAPEPTYSYFKRYSSGRVHILSPYIVDKLKSPVSISAYDLFATQLSGGLRSIYTAPFRFLMQEISSLSTYAIYPNTLRLPQIVSRENLLADDGANLASVIKRLNSGNRAKKERLLEALQGVIPAIVDLIVKSAGGFYVPVARVREANGDIHDFNMSQMSDGTLRILGLLSAFYQIGAPSKIALEEPEQMIHPGLLPLLKDAADDYLFTVPGSQYFVTTHSPHFLNLFKPEDITWMSCDNGVSIAGSTSQNYIDLIKDRLFSPGDILLKEGVGL